MADRGDRPRPRDRHARARRPGRGARSGRATASGGRRSSARRSARSAAGPSTRTPETLERDYDLDPLAAQNLLDFLREQQAATRVVPSDRTIVVERFRDEIGDWRLCVLTPVRRARARRLGARAVGAGSATSFGLESDAIWSDDGIIVHLPDADEPPGAELVLLEPDEVEDAVVGELGVERAVRRALPRERRPRAADPARLPGQAHAAVAAAAEVAVAARGRQALRRLPDHPRDLPRVPARRARRPRPRRPAARRCTAASCRWSRSRRRPRRRSPSSLLFDYVATYMYEGDTPNAERRAAALSLDRDLLRELLGQEELRDLIDPDALEQVEADLQHRSERTRAATRDALHDVLRRVGDLTAAEVARARPRGRRRRRAARDARARAPRDRAAHRRRGALGRRRRRRPLPRRARRRPARRAAGGVRRATSSARSRRSPPATRARTARSPPPSCAPATASTRRARCRRSSAPATLVRGELRPGGTRARVVRPRGPAPAAPRLARRRCARRSRPPTSARWRRSCRPGRASTATRRRAPGSTACARCSSRCRGWRCPPTSGSATCCRAAPARTRRRGWTSCARRGEVVWVGAGALGRNSGGRALLPRRRRGDRRPAPYKGERAGRARPRRRCASGSPPRRASSPTSSPSSRSRPRRSRRRSGTSSGPAR